MYKLKEKEELYKSYNKSEGKFAGPKGWIALVEELRKLDAEEKAEQKCDS